MEAVAAERSRATEELDEAGEQFELDVSLDEPTEAGPLSQVSREMVRLYREVFGRGPTKAHSEFAGPDTLICTLEESMTPAERNRVAKGEQERMQYVRMLFRHSTDSRFRSAVEEIFGRKVRSFAGSIDVEQDISSEIFYFEPRT